MLVTINESTWLITSYVSTDVRCANAQVNWLSVIAIATKTWNFKLCSLQYKATKRKFSEWKQAPAGWNPQKPTKLDGHDITSTPSLSQRPLNGHYNKYTCILCRGKPHVSECYTTDCVHMHTHTQPNTHTHGDNRPYMGTEIPKIDYSYSTADEAWCMYILASWAWGDFCMSTHI